VNAPQLYEIRVAGHLSQSWTARFEGLSILHEPAGEIVLPGRLDQAAHEQKQTYRGEKL